MHLTRIELVFQLLRDFLDALSKKWVLDSLELRADFPIGCVLVSFLFIESQQVY
jgi:hypothetical protein